MSATRETVASYRLYAANCFDLAERISDVERRVFFLRMARDWLKLADQVERAAMSHNGPEPARPDAPSDRSGCSR